MASPYAPVNGLELYYEVYGNGRSLPPLVLLHGGLGFTGMFADLLPDLPDDRQIVAVELQGHGRTADIDRPLRYELMGDDIAALIRHLGLDRVALLGYSLGGGVALRAAIQHPALVEKLILVSTPFRQTAWYPDVLAGMAALDGAAAPLMADAPMVTAYRSIAPRPQDFPRLLDKLGDLMRRPYDWSEEVAALPMPVLYVSGDADSFPPTHGAEFYALQGGGQRDAGWDGGGMPASRLAILPGTTHYDILASSQLAGMIAAFLATV